MGTTSIYLFDHSFPETSHFRISTLENRLKSHDITTHLLQTRDDLKTTINKLTESQLFIVHASEFQPEELSTLSQNTHAFFLFYSGAGFESTPIIPTTWSDKVICFKPSIDLLNENNLSLLTDFIHNFHLDSHGVLLQHKSRPTRLSHSKALIAIHHKMKSLLFLLKQNEHLSYLTPEFIQVWQHEFLTPIKSLNFQNPDQEYMVDRHLNRFQTWIDENSHCCPNIKQAIKQLNELRFDLYTFAQEHELNKKSFQDFNRVGRKTEVWIACFQDNLVEPCQNFLSIFDLSPHISQTLGPRSKSQHTYKTYDQLIEDLRSQNPEQLLDTYFILACPNSIRPLLNCGHQQHDDEAWKIASHSHMGLLSQIVMEFPQLNAHVIYFDGPKSHQQQCFTDELKLSIPPNIQQSQSILEQAFMHHFFDFNREQHLLLHSIENFLQGNRYLFDPTGLRTLLKLRLVANVFAGINKHGELDLENTLEQRKVIASRLDHLAIAVDEDINSANFHSYASYRYGWRAWTITTFKEFDHRHLWNSHAEHKLVIRDTDLRFPDINAREPYREGYGKTNVRYRLECVHSDLWKYLPDRKQKLGSDWHVRVITADRTHVSRQKFHYKSKEEFNKGESASQLRIEFNPLSQDPNYEKPYYHGIAKPFNSFYELAQLWRDEKSYPGMNETIAARLKPPARLMSKSGHFAPYINLPLAEQLLHQVKRCDGQHESGWLLSAILACEADEILLGLSEYSGLEAIRFLHRSEVMAEIESIGLSGRIRINDRRKEINRLVSTRYGDEISKQDEFLSRFWDDCRTLYKSAEQFTAAEQANIESFSKRKWLQTPLWLGKSEEWLRKGMILCASSLGAWAAFWFISNAVFFMLYTLVQTQHQNLSNIEFMFQVYISSLIGEPSFGFSENLGLQLSSSMKAIVFLHFGCSYILFGFFLSMVYRRITKS